MDQLLNEIRVAYVDVEINTMLGAVPDVTARRECAIRFNQSEDLFLELEAPILVPRFPIHHDVRRDEPGQIYLSSLREALSQAIALLPEVFNGLTYFFDPTEILKPRFYRLYKLEESIYLYILRLDLMFRSFEGEAVEQGTNDETPSYRTKRLFIESEIIPLEAVVWELGRAKAFKIKQLISNTWIGETGRGYLVHGIWMDADLSKFFTKLVAPDGTRMYPYYPLFCKYKTICAEAPYPSPDARKRLLPLLHRTIGFLTPEMDRIQQALKGGSFSETMPIFAELRDKMPAIWREQLSGMASKAYLNARDMKEVSLDFPDCKA
jgi:hypothetical protein